MTVRNTGQEDYEDVPIRITDSAGQFKNLGFRVPLIHRGESMVIPVTLIDRSRMNVRVTEHSAFPEYDDRDAEEQWWADVVATPTAFTIQPPGDSACSDDSLTTCWPTWNAHGFTSTKRVWILQGGIHKDHAGVTPP